MNREQAITLLRSAKPVLASQFGVTRLALFGSVVRDQASSDSDIDVLIAFAGAASAKSYFGAQFYLEDLLGGPVDLVTEKALRAELKPFIERDLIDV